MNLFYNVQHMEVSIDEIVYPESRIRSWWLVVRRRIGIFYVGSGF